MRDARLRVAEQDERRRHDNRRCLSQMADGILLMKRASPPARRVFPARGRQLVPPVPHRLGPLDRLELARRRIEPAERGRAWTIVRARRLLREGVEPPSGGAGSARSPASDRSERPSGSRAPCRRRRSAIGASVWKRRYARVISRSKSCANSSAPAASVARRCARSASLICPSQRYCSTASSTISPSSAAATTASGGRKCLHMKRV